MDDERKTRLAIGLFFGLMVSFAMYALQVTTGTGGAGLW